MMLYYTNKTKYEIENIIKIRKFELPNLHYLLEMEIEKVQRLPYKIWFCMCVCVL